SPSIDADGNAIVGADDFVTNPAGVDYPITVQILNQWGGPAFPEIVLTEAADTDTINVCRYLGKDLEFSVTNTNINGVDQTCNLGKMILNGTPGVVLVSAMAPDEDNPAITHNKINVYCGDVPAASKYVPTAYAPCGGRATAPRVQPDWIMPFPCNEESDTAEVILRNWEAFDKEGRLTVMTDTIVVFRLPLLTEGSFVGSPEDSFYCDIHPVITNGEPFKRYVSWKQAVG